MGEPVRVGEVLPGVVQEAIARAGPGYDRWAEQVAATGYCVHPVRLRGRVGQLDRATEERRTVYATDREPDATLLKACGNRRASVCPPCSATYQADSFQVLAAGLRGGKGVPETVAEHPRLFVTFTAPSFGKVHTRNARGLLVYPCHPYRQGQTCPHGRRVGCWNRHEEDDSRLGEPLCPRCYQTGAQVLWNALAGQLWSRTTIYLYRILAQLVGLSEADVRRLVRISFAKVAEYQKRGAVHFHAIIRLDAASDCGCPGCVAPPPAGFTAELLEVAVRQAAASVGVPCPALDEDQGVTLIARGGEELDVRLIAADDSGELSAEQVAGYVANYATKGTEALGVTLDHRICEVELEGLREQKFVAVLFKPAAVRAGLPRRLRFHDLRHTCASLLIAQGASVKAIQAQLGHASATVTLDRYGHLFPDELQQLAERLQEAYADAIADPARTETSEAALQIRKEAGQRPASRGGGGETRTPVPQRRPRASPSAAAG